MLSNDQTQTNPDGVPQRHLALDLSTATWGDAFGNTLYPARMHYLATIPATVQVTCYILRSRTICSIIPSTSEQHRGPKKKQENRKTNKKHLPNPGGLEKKISNKSIISALRTCYRSLSICRPLSAGKAAVAPPSSPSPPNKTASFSLGESSTSPPFPVPFSSGSPPPTTLSAPSPLAFSVEGAGVGVAGALAASAAGAVVAGPGEDTVV